MPVLREANHKGVGVADLSDWHEDSLRHKYDPLPDEPRYKKKSKKRHVRSDHKHEYEKVCIDAHDLLYRPDNKMLMYHLGQRCRICGRLYDWHMVPDLSEPPEGMPLYEVDGWDYLIDHKELPEERRVR